MILLVQATHKHFCRYSPTCPEATREEAADVEAKGPGGAGATASRDRAGSRCVPAEGEQTVQTGTWAMKSDR